MQREISLRERSPFLKKQKLYIEVSSVQPEKIKLTGQL